MYVACSVCGGSLQLYVCCVAVYISEVVLVDSYYYYCANILSNFYVIIKVLVLHECAFYYTVRETNWSSIRK